MNRQTNTEQGRTFERRVGHLFSLLGYRVSYDRLIGGRQVDLVVEQISGPLSHVYVVECKDQDRPVSTAQYDAFRGRLKAAKGELGGRTEGIIVASVGFVKEIIAQSAHEDIQLVTVRELERNLVDFRQYIADLMKALEADPSLRYFVQPHVRGDNVSVAEPAEEVFSRWLADPIANQMTLLGDYGTGKTTFLKHVALGLAKEYMRGSVGGGHTRVPILVDLRQEAKAVSMRELMLDFFDSHGIRVSSYAAFEYMLYEGLVVLMVDGFDEMASRGDAKATLRNFRELNRSARGGAKVVLSCRTHYFTAEEELQRHHGVAPGMYLHGQKYTDLYREIAARPNFVIRHLLEFDTAQVRGYLEMRCGVYASRVAAFIEKTYNLEELSRRPVLLDMIVASYGRLGGHSEAVSATDLYTVYTDIWLSRNDWCNTMDVQTKCALLERFAKRVAEEPKKALHFTELPMLVREWRGDVGEIAAEEIDRELRAASFLVRDGSGYYRFSHKSFFEYFYARQLLRDVELLGGRSWEGSFFTTEVYRFVRGLAPSEEVVVGILVPWITDGLRDEFARTNAIKCLGGIRRSDVERALVQALSHDPVDRIRWSAATALWAYQREETVDCLIRAFKEDRCSDVRANSLAALARNNTDTSIAFLRTFLEEQGQEYVRKGKSANLFFSALRSCRDLELVGRAVEMAPVAPVGRRNGVVREVLALCQLLRSEACLRYCERFLESTSSPVQAASALTLLPPERRIRFVEKVAEQVRREIGRPYVAPLVSALVGLKREDVRDLLISVVNAGKPETAVPAIAVLREDYAGEAMDCARRWMLARQQSYEIRVAAAHLFAEVAKERAVGSLMKLLNARERVVIQRTGLDLICRYNPNQVEAAVRRIWDAGGAGDVPVLARWSLEMMMQAAPQSAFGIIQERGLRARRDGVRVAVCAVLCGVVTVEATNVLLEMLRSDNSHFVRMEALRSLCVPGRSVARNDILSASSGEQHQMVLKLRSELLGAQVDV